LKKIALATIALVGLGSAFATVPAFAAAPPSGPGAVCQFTSVSDPTVEGDVQTGQISGGPLVTVNVDTANPAASGPQTGTLSCYLQVDNANPTGPIGNPGVSGTGTGVVTAGPGQVTYTATATQNVYLCSQWTDSSDGTIWYFNDTTSDFSTTASPCGLAVSASTPDESGPLDGVFNLLNATVCPVLITVDHITNETPDLSAIWGDCEPYAGII
jgi:hypothetical protein